MGRNLRGAALAALAALLLACGGDIVGVGNSGNHFFSDPLDELAGQLHAWPGVPQVEERDLARIYQALVQRAREGDPSAARVVLALAERQRKAEDD